MSERALARPQDAAIITPATMEKVLQNDLSILTPAQRVEFYLARCEAAGLDYRTKPFDYLSLNGKTMLYANATAAQQAAEKRGLCLAIVGRERMDDVYVVTCRVSDGAGRYTESTGAVPLGNAKGEQLANALMKAETKAKRRAVLSFCGLGMLDDTEVETIPGARRVTVTDHGEIIEPTGQVVDMRPQLEAQNRQEQAAAPIMDYAASTAASIAALAWKGPKKRLFEDVLGCELQDLRSLAEDQRRDIAERLKLAESARKAALAAYQGKVNAASLEEQGYAQLLGEDPRDREVRLIHFAELAGSDGLTSSGELLPSQWGKLATRLNECCRVLRQEQREAGQPASAVVEAELVNDPFEGE